MDGQTHPTFHPKSVFSGVFSMLDEMLDAFEQGLNKTVFTRCRHILKTVKDVTDRPPVHMKTTHILQVGFENGRF